MERRTRLSIPRALAGALVYDFLFGSDSISTRRIALIHHDLGIGGAERLCAEAAFAFAELGYEAQVHTAYYNDTSGFFKNAGPKVSVHLHRMPLPRQLFGALRAPLVIARMHLLAQRAQATGPFDAYFLDEHPALAPYLQRTTNKPVLYYCHFPDFLLAPRQGLWRDLYRHPIDRFERRSVRAANRVLVNSAFTKSVVLREYGELSHDVQIVHPPVAPPSVGTVPQEAGLILGIHRFDLSKNLLMAIEAIDLLRKELHAPVRLVLAGGYDARFAHCREAMTRLRQEITDKHLHNQVELIANPSDEQLSRLYAACTSILYTPLAEHFGLVPIEAMAAGRPVVAVRAGGPLETIVDGETGFLVEPNPKAFAHALAQLITQPELAQQMGRAGQQRAALFSREVFQARLGAILKEVIRD